MNLPEEYYDLAIKLIELSNNNKVTWEAGEETEYILSHKSFRIELYPYSVPEEEKNYYHMSFQKADGTVDDGFDVSNWDYGYETLVTLYSSASRNAQGVRGAINEFLSGFDE